MHRHGLGTQRSCDTAVELLKRVAERGFRKDMLEPPFRSWQEGDTWRALHGYEIAAEYGYEVAQSNVAFLLSATQAQLRDELLRAADSPVRVEKLNAELRVVTRQLVRRLVDAAEQNSAEAHRMLGDVHYHGRSEGGEVSYARALAFYEAASARRDAEATFALGFMHEHGLGVARDGHLAKRYYDLTAQIEPAAALATFFPLLALGARRSVDHVQYMCSAEYDGVEWGLGHDYRANCDTLLIGVLSLLLLLVVCVRTTCLN